MAWTKEQACTFVARRWDSGVLRNHVEQQVDETAKSVGGITMEREVLVARIFEVLIARANQGIITDEASMLLGAKELAAGMTGLCGQKSLATGKANRIGAEVVAADVTPKEATKQRERTHLYLGLSTVKDDTDRMILFLHLQGVGLRRIGAQVRLNYKTVDERLERVKAELQLLLKQLRPEELGWRLALAAALERSARHPALDDRDQAQEPGRADDEIDQNNTADRQSRKRRLLGAAAMWALLPAGAAIVIVTIASAPAPPSTAVPASQPPDVLPTPKHAGAIKHPVIVPARPMADVSGSEVSNGPDVLDSVTPTPSVEAPPVPAPPAPTEATAPSTAKGLPGPPMFSVTPTTVLSPTTYPEYPGMIAVPSDPPGASSSYWLPSDFCSQYAGLRMCMGRHILNCGHEGTPMSFVDCFSDRCVGTNDNPMADPVCVAEGDPRAGPALCSGLRDGRYRYYQVAVTCRQGEPVAWDNSVNPKQPLRGRYPEDKQPFSGSSTSIILSP